MRRARTLLAASVGVVAVLALSVGVALFAISSGWQRERLRSGVEALLADALGDEVAIGTVRGPLLPRLVVKDVRIGSAEAPSITLERLVLRLAVRRSIASRSVVLRALEVEGAQVLLARDANGDWDLPPWLRGPASTELPAVQVLRTQIEAVSAHIRWLEDGDAAGIAVTGSGALGPWSLASSVDSLRGALHVQAKGEGAAAKWLDAALMDATFEGRLVSVRELSLSGGGYPPLGLERPASLRLEQTGVRIEDLALRSEEQTLVVRGGLSGEGFDDFQLEARDLDLTLVGRLLDPAGRPGGRVSGTLRLDGAFGRPVGRADLVWNEATLDGWRAERVTLRASGDGREIRFDTLTASGAPGGDLRLRRPALLRVRDDGVELEDFELESASQSILADGGVTNRGFRSLHLELRDLDLALAGRLLGVATAPAGSIGGTLHLDGPFSRPTGAVDLQWSDPRWAGWQAERVDLRADLEGERVRLDLRIPRAGRDEHTLALSMPSAALERIARRGSLDALPEGLHAHLRSDAADLDTFRSLLPESLHALSGLASADLQLVGGASPQLHGTLELDRASLKLPGRRPIDDLHARLELDPEPAALRIARFELEAPALTLTASGTLTEEGPSPLDLTLRVVDLEALAEAHGLGAPLVGRFDAEASLRGDWQRPAIRGTAGWTHPAPGLTRPHRVDLAFESADREIVGALRVHQRGRVAARGELRLPYADAGIRGLPEAASQGAALDLDAEDFDLATLGPLLPRLVRNLQGRADARLELRAGLERPSLSGTLAVRGGSIRVPVLRQTFEPIDLGVRFEGDVLRIDRLRVGQEGAHADLTGNVRFADALRPAAVEIDVALVRFPLARSRPLTTDVGGALRLEGPPDVLRLDGELALSDVRVRLVELGDPALREIEVVASDAERRGRSGMREELQGMPAFDQATIDVALTVPRNSWVRGRGADLDLAGTLRLDKVPGDAARLSGSVAAVRGIYRFQGKRFELRRGEVSFEGGVEPDPLLDIEAIHRVRGVTIVIQLSGRASEPLVTLTSEPSLPEDDVLSYLFFGRSTADLGSKKPTGDLDRAAAALAAGIALREAARLVEDVIPIDTIDVRIEEDGSAGDVGVGKYLTDDLFVRYERSFGEDAADGVRIELRLTDQWSIETEASTDESAGADLVWSYDY